MISFDEAVEHIRQEACAPAIETIPISSAAWRVLARPVIACVDSPRADVSAMDGYAVRDEDLASCPASLRVVGESFAGSSSSSKVVPGTCIRIFTGAALPDGADRVVIQENVVRQDEIAMVEWHPGPARHIRKRGGDFHAGQTLLPQGRLLDPRAIVAAAGADLSQLDVYVRPTVTILGTGDELAEPGTAAARADAIPESVSFGIAALAEEWGGLVSGRHRLRDDLPTMRRAAEEAIAGSDLIIVTGGASVGERDFAKTMFDEQGLELVFSKVAIKPGKPVWFGRAGRALVMGLPGNPTSALVTARLLLAPLLCGLTGRTIDEALHWRSCPLASDMKACGSRETFYRAHWSDGRVDLLANQDSSAQHALAAADLLVRQRANAPAQRTGESVEVLAF